MIFEEIIEAVVTNKPLEIKVGFFWYDVERIDASDKVCTCYTGTNGWISNRNIDEIRAKVGAL